jgi:hypothetical protein
MRDHCEKTKQGVNASRAARYQCCTEADEEKEMHSCIIMIILCGSWSHRAPKRAFASRIKLFKLEQHGRQNNVTFEPVGHLISKCQRNFMTWSNESRN